ncbi:hypothetical protein NB525_12880 [Vibrio alginolyticus]|uniref:hypothetical protein n=1 Tax=Vibrio harveyi group TaxID=717610 RepID=UPI00041AE9AD|nr:MULTISPECIES: hypothetical protein [Vibrio harveyi group]HCE2205239.1 hypothetical protein [Vibrio parahaemolyticus]EGQ8152637.1 hypothetical protein [Vibrio alginolyticus]MCR9594882.1 hypothetical protein [Vibrio alginolyticus]MCR9627623.1 hypothetical protein [Vibrio antiquarius]MCR9633550.1 hypothetical protein [Vibrio antiquarius]
MKESDIVSETDAQNTYNELFEAATKESVKTTLKNINEICEKMVAANAPPSVPAIVKALASKGVIISERSIYNRREGKNPYPILIDAWISVVQKKKLGIDAIVKSSLKAKPDTGIAIEKPNAFVTEQDLLKISDPVLRYKISVLYGHVTALNKQNIALRELRELPAIHPDYHTQPSTKNLEEKRNIPTQTSHLDSLDVEILRNFLDGQHGQLYFDDEGALYAAKGLRSHTAISDPGLKEVLEKLIPPEVN